MQLLKETLVSNNFYFIIDGLSSFLISFCKTISSLFFYLISCIFETKLLIFVVFWNKCLTASYP